MFAFLHFLNTCVFRNWRRDAIRRRLDIRGTTLLTVGHLVAAKGHHLALAALNALPDANLIIAGDGPMHTQLRRQAQRAGVADRVRFSGGVSQHELVDYYNAADALILASEREGMPNVILEALACGTPVIATRTGGIVESLLATLRQDCL